MKQQPDVPHSSRRMGARGAERGNDDSAPEPGDEIDTATAGPRRLWTPWRMTYVGGGSREAGCIFCNRLAANDDARTLILHRGPRSFVIMNLYPYNTGHVMIVPNEHLASPEDADAETLAEMATLRSPLLRALRRALSAEGFNIGLNLGAIAGAGVADHFHEHVVPRWQGDANFMPILAATMVIPELIPVTYAKLRAELTSELSGTRRAAMLVRDRDSDRVLTLDDGSLPAVTAAGGEPIWRSVMSEVTRLGAEKAEILGWAGDAPAGKDDIVIALSADLHEARLPAGHHLTRPLYSTP